MADEDFDPIAKKLKKAVADTKEEKAASTGEQLLHADFEALARKKRSGRI